MTLYLLRSVTGQWEEVSEYVYANRKFALTDFDEFRYDGTAVKLDGGVIHVEGTISTKEMGPICRMLGVEVSVGALGKACIQAPTTIKFKKGRSTFLHCLATQENWVKR